MNSVVIPIPKNKYRITYISITFLILPEGIVKKDFVIHVNILH